MTYSGHPLYFFVKDIKDGDPSDDYGEALKAFGAEWYVLAASGNEIDNSGVAIIARQRSGWGSADPNATVNGCAVAGACSLCK